MPTALLTALETDWHLLASSPAARRVLRRWSATDEALAGFEDLHQLLAHVQRRGFPAQSDRLLAALAARAPCDDLAARTLLQALLPGFKSLVVAYRWTGPAEDVASAVVAAGYERIRTYPIDRRPARIAANVLHDTRQVMFRRAQRAALLREEVGPVESEDALSGGDPADGEERSSGEELLGLVGEAVRRGLLSRENARLIIVSRIGDVPLAELAALEGCELQTMRRRRLRAEARLLLLVA